MFLLKNDRISRVEEAGVSAAESRGNKRSIKYLPAADGRKAQLASAASMALYMTCNG